MTARWTAEDRERKRRMIQGLLQSFLATIELRHPQTELPCTRQEAIWVLRGMQAHTIKKYEQKYGAEIAERYRELIEEVIGEFQQQADN